MWFFVHEQGIFIAQEQMIPSFASDNNQASAFFFIFIPLLASSYNTHTCMHTSSRPCPIIIMLKMWLFSCRLFRLLFRVAIGLYTFTC